MPEKNKKNKLLLHICCAGCGAYVSKLLSEQFEVTLFFYNPNIFPEEEYDKRVLEVQKIADFYKLKIIFGAYNHNLWLDKIKGHENDPEKGRRCLICYFERLNETAITAQKSRMNFFSSTLTVSPHKLAKEIFNIGKALEEKYKISFLAEDFKKKDGFKNANLLSNELGLYRQNYCGCEFSRR